MSEVLANDLITPDAGADPLLSLGDVLRGQRLHQRQHRRASALRHHPGGPPRGALRRDRGPDREFPELDHPSNSHHALRSRPAIRRSLWLMELPSLLAAGGLGILVFSRLFGAKDIWTALFQVEWLDPESPARWVKNARYCPETYVLLQYSVSGPYPQWLRLNG